ncbi:hypothetical protein [Alloscardovia venturai]
MRKVANDIEKTGIVARYRSATSIDEQISLAQSAIAAYPRIIVLPKDTLTESTVKKWMPVLISARSHGVAIVIAQSISHGAADAAHATHQTSVPVSEKYYAALWNFERSTATKDTYSLFKAAMTIVEDKPHNTVMTIVKD